MMSIQDFGRYHIIEPLGTGGMASVYKAYDTRLERIVALKVIRTDAFPAASLEQVTQRFEREAKALARLSHPNIVKIYDFGEQEGTPYLVMEYIQGGTLKKLSGKPMPWHQATALILPISKAVFYAHQHNILHRDIKPANILITDNGEPMLTDFGIAKILDICEGQTLTGTGVGIGTPDYMAPEQGKGLELDQRADIYALGVVFYELITGHKPFSADTPMAVLLKHITDTLPSPRQFVKDLPEAVEMVIFKALAKDRQDRYQDMGEFTAALEKILAIEPTRPTPAPSKSYGAHNLRWILYIGVPSLAILLVIVAIFLLARTQFMRDLFSKLREVASFNQRTTATPLIETTPTIIIEPTSTAALIYTETPGIPPPTNTVSPTNTPKVWDVSFCAQPCNGQNKTYSFPERTTRIYMQWQYENIPPNAHYVRSWSWEGKEWVRYDCNWDGPESGEDNVTLKEPQGLRSGTWEVTILVEGNLLMKERIFIEGSWDYWSPAGVFNVCHK